MLRKAIVALAIAPLGAGCAADPVSHAVVARTTPGLANVPWISGSPITDDVPPTDVVSNGLDACNHGYERGPLWNQWPSCPAGPPPAVAGRALLPTSNGAASAELVRPWQEVTVFAWPCTAGSRGGAGEDDASGVRCR
ncbi:MAG TPA: hypothetical protein VH044_00770 [Polyangiaceae bacterium]|jgi:hypothetical protein|nr:hypothetical protein [Polyangiaceae bacterium]